MQGAVQAHPSTQGVLRRQEKLSRQFLSVLERMRDGFVMLGAEGEVEYANARGARILRSDPAAVIGRNILELLPAAAAHAAALAGGTPSDEPISFEDFCPDTRCWFEVRIHRLEEGFAVYFQDITAAKEALARSEGEAKRLANIFRSLTDGFGLIDHDWRVRFANPAAAQILGTSIPELFGDKTIWELFPGLERSPFADFYRNAMTHRRVEEMENYYAPLGLWLRARCFPVDEGVAVSFADITAQKQAQEEVTRLTTRLEKRVEQRTQQLQQAYKDLESFSFMLAHDLRAPIRAIDGFSGFLQESDEQALGPRSRQLLDRIRAAAHRMEDLTSAILGLAKISYRPLESRSVDLTAIAEEIAGSLAAAQPERQVRVVVQPGMQAFGDPALLTLVMQNLLANAWKYTARTPDAQIQVGGDERNGFCVRDNGCGFDDVAGRLFQPFCRLHGAEYEGTGLGLASVARAVARHGGAITASSTPGQGACFHFTLRATQEVPTCQC